jgi:hypothetical protein
MGSKDTDNPSPTLSSAIHPDHHSDDEKPNPGTPDRVNLGNDTTTYTNSGHWTSILDGVSSPIPQRLKRNSRCNLAFDIIDMGAP